MYTEKQTLLRDLHRNDSLASNREAPLAAYEDPNTLIPELEKRIEDIKGIMSTKGSAIGRLASYIDGVRRNTNATDRYKKLVEKTTSFMMFSRMAIREANPSVQEEAQWLRTMVYKGDEIVSSWKKLSLLGLISASIESFFGLTGYVLRLPITAFVKIKETVVPRILTTVAPRPEVIPPSAKAEPAIEIPAERVVEDEIKPQVVPSAIVPIPGKEPVPEPEPKPDTPPAPVPGPGEEALPAEFSPETKKIMSYALAGISILILFSLFTGKK